MIVLGIETSCDDTAAAVVKDGCRILSSVVLSQITLHHPYGGVVPELASRKHLEAIVPVTTQAIQQAGIPFNKIDVIAATRGPGLVGSLLVGASFAKACAYSLGIPWVGVDHLEGHINSIFLEPEVPPFPFTALLVSGGHTSIYYVTGHAEYELLGQTRDDAAGEAFDKVAKMLGLGYPGGQIIDTLSRKGDPDKIKFPRAYIDKTKFDFSFSGVKTAVNRYIQSRPDTYLEEISDIVAGFQEAVVEVLSFKLIQAAIQKKCKHIAVVGGVAANQRLRNKVCKDASTHDIATYLPSIKYCGDNAAMIAALGYHYIENKKMSHINEDVYSRMLHSKNSLLQKQKKYAKI
jgi:tRNA N6-adenosine threonylcarbamoyltransferase